MFNEKVEELYQSSTSLGTEEAKNEGRHANTFLNISVHMFLLINLGYDGMFSDRRIIFRTNHTGARRTFPVKDAESSY